MSTKLEDFIKQKFKKLDLSPVEGYDQILRDLAIILNTRAGLKLKEKSYNRLCAYFSYKTLEEFNNAKTTRKGRS